VFDEVADDNVPYVLTWRGRPQAALIPYETFLPPLGSISVLGQKGGK